MALSRIRKTGISDEIYNQILETIEKDELHPGDKLPSEVELAETMGVSRVSVRNAVQRLVGQGVLESRHGEGTFVSSLSFDGLFSNIIPLLSVRKEQIVELYEFRRILETGNIRRLAEVIDPELIDRLEANYSRMRASADDIPRFVECDIEFHRLIADGTGNAIMSNIYGSIREALYPKQLMVQTAFGVKGALKYHRLILDSLRDAYFDKAEEFMDEHMKMTITNIKTEKQNIV